MKVNFKKCLWKLVDIASFVSIAFTIISIFFVPTFIRTTIMMASWYIIGINLTKGIKDIYNKPTPKDTTEFVFNGVIYGFAPIAIFTCFIALPLWLILCLLFGCNMK